MGRCSGSKGETHRRKQKSKKILTNVYRKESCEEREDRDIRLQTRGETEEAQTFTDYKVYGKNKSTQTL